MPRVIAGKFKGLNLKSLKGEHTRPSGDRLKEAFFSIVQAKIPEATFLDLFAGSGQMGIEAISRGAAQSVFCEKNRAAYRILEENLVLCGLSSEVEVHQMDARRLLKLCREQKRKFDLIYVDPPWQLAEKLFPKLQEDLFALLLPGGQIIWEVESNLLKTSPDIVENCSRTCHYGRAMLLFYNNQED